MKTRSAAATLAIVIPLLLIAGNVRAADTGSLLHDEGVTKATMADISAAYNELAPLLGKGEVFSDEAKRAAAAPKAVADLQRIIAGFDLLQVHFLRTAGGVEFKFHPLAMLAYFGDAKTHTRLIDDTKSKDPGVIIESQCALALCDWWKSAHNSAGQQKVLDKLKAQVLEHPTDDQFTIALMMMAGNAATPQLHDSATKIISENLKGAFAQQYAKTLQIEAKLKAMEGKPLVIAGKALDGKEFTTADWKGKVILVDFWASWCAPCKAELPRVKKIYADYHGKGLEILGVSCDNAEKPLQTYLSQNPEMAWPQLFDTAHPGWHAIAKGFGVQSIPTMFLIDKTGVVRSVTARKDFEQQIPKLLEE